MNPSKVSRQRLNRLTDLPNIGPASAGDLELLGIHRPEQLKGQQPIQMYQRLCQMTGQRHDPCVLDVFLSVVGFIEGDPPRPWWEYTAQRKIDFPDL